MIPLSVHMLCTLLYMLMLSYTLCLSAFPSIPYLVMHTAHLRPDWTLCRAIHRRLGQQVEPFSRDKDRPQPGGILLRWVPSLLPTSYRFAPLCLADCPLLYAARVRHIDHINSRHTLHTAHHSHSYTPVGKWEVKESDVFA